MGAERPVPRRPDQRPLRLSPSSWLTLLVATALALLAIALFPRSGGDSPPLASLALIGAAVASIMTVALYAIVRRQLGVPARFAASLAVAFALIGIVKFLLAPFGLYEVNAVRTLDDYFGTVGDLGGTAITAATVFGLYVLGYVIVYRVAYGDRAPIRRREPDRARRPIGATTLIVGLALGLLAISSVGILVLVVLNAPRQYLEFVFSSGAGLIVAAALAVAATLIGSAFRALGRHPRALADVGTVVTLFWLGLGFLALFHVLWIVYVLVLGSIWPLKTVVPK